MNKLEKSTLPINKPSGGIRISLTREVTTLPKATPMMTPMAMSITFPLRANSLNSFSMANSFNSFNMTVPPMLAPPAAPSLPLARSSREVRGLAEGGSQFRVGLGHRKLGKLLRDVARRPEKNAGIGGYEHGRVVIGVPRGDYMEVEALQCEHRRTLLFGQAQAVIDDPAVRREFQGVAENGRVVELPHQGRGELFECVRQDDHLEARPEPCQEVLRAVERRHRGDHVLDILQGKLALIQDLEAPLHEHIVVRLVSRCQAQLGDLCLLGHADPDLGHEDALQIKTRHDRFDLGHDRCGYFFVDRAMQARTRVVSWGIENGFPR